jgi:hypothetical protein
LSNETAATNNKHKHGREALVPIAPRQTETAQIKLKVEANNIIATQQGNETQVGARERA